MAELKLIAFDADDLAVISAHLQDAVLKVGDIAYLPRERRFAAVGNRFDWADALRAATRPQEYARRRTALRFERVLGAQVQGIDLRQQGCACSPCWRSASSRARRPAGHVTLHFADGARHPAAGGVHRGRAEGPGAGVAGEVDAAAPRRTIRRQRETPEREQPPPRARATPCPSTSTTSDPDFESAFAAFLATKREVVRGRRRGGARHHRRRCARDGDAAADRADAPVRPARPRRGRHARRARPRSPRRWRRATRRRWPRSSWRARASRATTAASCPRDDRYTDALGAELGSRWTAVESVGLYVPGGLASYPSSVLMNAVPARVAGVPRVAMVVPSPGGEMNPLVLAAAHLAGVAEIYRIGGAQAVAALAYGTETRARRSPRSSGPATPTSPPPSGRCSARSASIRSPGRPRCWSSPTATTIPNGSPPTCWPRPSTTPPRRPS